MVDRLTGAHMFIVFSATRALTDFNCDNIVYYTKYSFGLIVILMKNVFIRLYQAAQSMKYYMILTKIKFITLINTRVVLKSSKDYFLLFSKVSPS